MLRILRHAATSNTNSIARFQNRIQFRRYSNDQPSLAQKILASTLFPDKSKYPPSGTYIPLPIPHVANGEGGREYSLKYLWENRRTNTYLLSLLVTLLGSGFILYEYYRFENKDKREFNFNVPADLSIFIRGYLRNDVVLNTILSMVYNANDEQSLLRGGSLLGVINYIIFNDAESQNYVFNRIDFKQIAEVIERNQRNRIPTSEITPIDVYTIFLSKCAETKIGLRKLVDEGIDEKIFNWFIERPSIPLLTLLRTLSFTDETRQKMNNNEKLMASLKTFVFENRHLEGINNILKTIREPTAPDWQKPVAMDTHMQTMEFNALINGFAWGFLRYFAGYFKHIRSSSAAMSALKFSSLGGLKTGFWAMAPFVIARYATFIHYDNEKDINYLIARDQMIQLVLFQASWLLATRNAPFTLVPTMTALVYGAIPEYFPEYYPE